MTGRYKYLLKNIGLMTISNFTSKILSFLLVPLYTSVLTTTEFGTYDLYATTCFLFTPMLSVCIAEAVLLFLLDKSKEPSKVFNIAIKFYVKACLFMVGLVLLNYLTGFVGIFNEYPIFLLLYFALSLLSDVMTQFLRGLGRIVDVAVAGILSSIVSISLNVLLLLVFQMGLNGYFIAYCSSFAITSIYLMIRAKVWRYIKFQKKDKSLQKEMVRYSKPLILNQISWWINNVSDRYIVTWLCGTALNGVYSVAYKIPSILTIVQTIFNQAWTLSAVKEYDGKSGEFYSNIYKVYNCGMVIVCAILIVCNKIIAKVLFANEFYMAWKYAPFLIVSVVFSSLSHLLGGIFNATRQSNVIARTTAVGASVNTVLNVVLVFMFGPIGAAIATLISYIFVWIARLKEVNKSIALSIQLKRDIFSYIILIVQVIILLSNLKVLVAYLLELVLLGVIVFIYRDDLHVIICKIGRKNS